MFTKKRKVLILVGLFVLLIVTGYLNFTLNKDTPAGAAASTQVNVFTSYRNTRADERAGDTLIYQSIIGNSNYSAAAQASAEQSLLDLRTNMAFETQSEGLILMEGYSDCIVNRSNGFINVLIQRDTNIDSTQAAKVMSILRSVDPTVDIDDVYISIMQ